MTTEQLKRFYDLITGDDMDFYEEYILDLPDKQQRKFFQENPEFMSEYSVNSGRIELLKDKMYRGILRKIKEYERVNGGM